MTTFKEYLNESFKMTKALETFALKNGIQVVVDEDGKQNVVSFYDKKDNEEPFMTYFLNDKGLTFKGNLSLPKDVKEELPQWIDSTAKFKEVITFLKSELSL